MLKIKKRIEIVSSTNPNFSSMGRKSRESTFAVLSKHYSDVRITIINEPSDLVHLVERKPDLVFLGMKFISQKSEFGSVHPKKIWLSQYLDEFYIAYTGSGELAHKLEQNKPLAKLRVLENGLKTSSFYVALRNQTLKSTDIKLRYPLFVKPTDRGGGQGIDSDSVAYDFAQVICKVKSISDIHDSDSLIEEYLPGREISVAILKNDTTNEYDVMPIERIVPPNEKGISILSPDVKHADAGLSVDVSDALVKSEVCQLALDVFHALGARDYGRIDTRMDANGTPNFLEANLIPSLIDNYGNFPKACKLNIDLNHEDMILKIVKLGLGRELNSALVINKPVINKSSLAPVFDVS